MTDWSPNEPAIEVAMKKWAELLEAQKRRMEEAPVVAPRLDLFAPWNAMEGMTRIALALLQSPTEISDASLVATFAADIYRELAHRVNDFNHATARIRSALEQASEYLADPSAARRAGDDVLAELRNAVQAIYDGR